MEGSKAIMIATTSALIPFAGREVCIAGGRTTVREGHPILKGREHMFRVLVPDYEVEVPLPAKEVPPAAKPAGVASAVPAVKAAAQVPPAAGVSAGGTSGADG